MSDAELVGEVRVKVRPDSEDFRREAGREIDQAVRGLRGEVPLDGKLRVNTQQLQRQLDDARQRLKGGDVKIVAKLESNIDKSYKQFLDAKTALKEMRSEARAYHDEMKRAGKTDPSTMDGLWKGISETHKRMQELKATHEELKRMRESDPAQFTARDNLAIERLVESLETNSEKIQKMTAAELRAYRESSAGKTEWYEAEEEFQRRLSQLRLNSHWDYQRQQAQNNAEIERENARHQQAMSRRFDLRGMPEDAEQWTTQELIRARKLANEGILDEANALRVMAEVKRRLRQAQLEQALDPMHAMRSAANKASLREYMQKVDNHGIEAQWQKIRDEAKKTNDEINNLKPTIKIQETGLLSMAAQLKWASRPRHVPFYARVDEKSLLIAEGMLKSLSGLNSLEQTGRWLENILVDFDKFSIKAGTVSTAIAALVNTTAFLGTGAFAVGGDLSKMLAGWTMIPAALAAMGASMVIHTAAFNDFKDAVDGDAEALARIPPNARAAAESLQGLWERVSRPVQNAFWEGMGDEFAKTVQVLEGPMTRGLADTGLALGESWAIAARSIQEIALGGDIETVFGNLSEASRTSAGAVDPLIQAINTLGLRGSEYLPEMGTWVSDIATGFNDWITEADKVGDIDVWIMQAKDALFQTWDIGGSVVSMFKSLTEVANNAGAGGLPELADSLDRIAQKMAGEPWQSRMSIILGGARRGASELNEGFLDLSDTIGESAIPVSRMLDLLGQLGGGALSRVADAFGRTKLQGGIIDSLQGLNDLVDELEPGFEDLGDVIGDFSGIAGDVFRNLSPVLNGGIGLLADLTGKLAPHLEEVVPPLTDFLALIIDLSGGPLHIVADTLAGVLGIFNDLPGPAQTAVLALAGIVAMRGQLGSFIDLLGRGATGAFSSLTAEVQKAPGAFAPLRTAWREQRDLARMAGGAYSSFATSVEQVGRGRAALGHLAQGVDTLQRTMNLTHLMTARDRIAAIGTAAAQATGHFGRGAKQGLIGAAGGLMGALGGPWGLAIGGAIAAVGFFAQKQADAKAEVESLTAALDAQTGEMDGMGRRDIGMRWTDLDEMNDKWANLNRGARAANETAEALGLNLSDVTNAIADGGPAYDDLIGHLGAISEYRSAAELHAGDMGMVDELSGMKTQAELSAKALGTNLDAVMALNGADYSHLLSNIQQERAKVEMANAAWEAKGEVLGTTSENAKLMSGAMEAIADRASDAASKIDAVNTALDLLAGGKLSKQEAEMAAATTLQNAVKQAEGLKEAVAAAGDQFIGPDGLLSSATEAGQGVYDALDSSADAIKTHALSTYQSLRNQDKTHEEAMAGARKIVEAGNADLAAIAEAAGVSVETLQAQWDTFFGEDWHLEAVFSASADKIQEAMTLAKEMGIAWEQEEFEAWLFAQDDPAKVTTEQLTQFMKDRMGEQFAAALTAIPTEALATLSVVTAEMRNWTNEQWIAHLKSLDATHPGISAAVGSIANMTGGDYAAAIEAINATRNGISSAEQSLWGLSDEQVAIISQWAGIPPAPHVPDITVRIRPDYTAVDAFTSRFVNPQALNGAIWDGKNPWAGKFPFQQFLDGGFYEKPGGAKIYSPASTFRVFAERATGGESYIPLAAAKRDRSIEIWEETGKRLGVYEDGGIDGAGRLTGRLANGSDNRPINITINGVRMDYAQETASTILTALKRASRSG